MPRHYILVDFENVQPASLGALKAGDAYIKVFAGQHQTRVDLGLAQALQPFGLHAEYIQIVGNGKDALDFHIAYYIGRLSAEHPGSKFTIVSKDTGFDPLIKHLDARGITCNRVATLPGANMPKLPATKAAPAKKTAKVAKAVAKVTRAPAKAAKAAPAVVHPRLSQVLERLAGMKKARPGTVKTLRSSLKAFTPPLADAEIDTMLELLQRNGVIKVTGTKVAYTLPGGG